MKDIAVIGIGMGKKEALSEESQRRIREAGLCIGAKRMLEAAVRVRENSACRMICCYQAQEIVRYAEEASEEQIVLLFSGDTGFFSGARSVCGMLKQKGFTVSVYPGISSLSALCARLGTGWEDVYTVSLHGRTANAAYAVRTHARTFFLLDESVKAFAGHLTAYGLGEVRLSAAERLSYPEEKVICGRAAELAEGKEEQTEESSLVCVLAENEAAVTESGWFPEERFLRRPGIPMSKEAVRLFAANSFPIREDDVLYDVGSGSGSVSVALAAKVPYGKVYAAEQKAEAAELTAENARRFGMDQIVPVKGRAPEVFGNLPAPSGVFIGGSGGRLTAILENIPGGQFWFLIAAVTLETLGEASDLQKRAEVSEFTVRQIAVSHTEKRGNSSLLFSENAVYLIGGRWDGTTAKEAQ